MRSKNREYSNELNALWATLRTGTCGAIPADALSGGLNRRFRKSHVERFSEPGTLLAGLLLMKGGYGHYLVRLERRVIPGGLYVDMRIVETT